MEPFANMANYVGKKLDHRGGLYGGECQPGLKFQLVKRQRCKNRIPIICKNFITVNRAEISPRFGNNNVMDNKCQSGLKMIDCARGFKLEKQIDECFSRTMLN